MSTAILHIEPGKIPASQAPESLTTGQLVEIAAGTFQRIQDSMPYIIELRKRFKAAPRGKADIAGCDTWEEFCEKHLHRTASAIRKAVQSDLEPQQEPNPPAPHDNLREKPHVKCSRRTCPILFDTETQRDRHVRREHEDAPLTYKAKLRVYVDKISEADARLVCEFIEQLSKKAG